MKTTNCATPDDLLTALDQRAVSPTTGQRRWIYRGQGDANWPLLPSAFRPDTRFPGGSGNFTVVERLKADKKLRKAFQAKLPELTDDLFFEVMQAGTEFDLVTRFFVAVDEAGLSLPEDSQLIRDRLFVVAGLRIEAGLDWLLTWPPLELRSVLALAQHHGLPTRLLDWTQDSRVAAFFSAQTCIKEKTEALAVFALDKEQVRVETILDRLRRARAVEGGSCNLALVTAPSATNANLRAQRGLFTVLEANVLMSDWKSRTANLAAARRPLDQMPFTIKKFVMPSTRASELLKLLRLEGVSSASVWPGYDGVVRSIKDQAEGKG